MAEIDVDELREAMADVERRRSQLVDCNCDFECVHIREWGAFKRAEGRLLRLAPTLAAAYLAKCEEVEALRQYRAEAEPALGAVIRALMQIEQSTDTREQGRLAMAALAALRTPLGEDKTDG